MADRANEKPNLVIGALGLNSSGKDELVDYLARRCGARVFSLGDEARKLAEEEGLSPTRENLHRISKKYIEERGDDFFIRRLIERMDASGPEAAAVSVVRRPVDARVLKKHYGEDCLLVEVRVDDDRIRFERSRKRGSARDAEDFAEFLEEDREERRRFALDETMKTADLVIPNNGTLDEFRRRIDRVLVDSILTPAGLCPFGPRQGE
jgi:dephospho-CoA kinase